MWSGPYSFLDSMVRYTRKRHALHGESCRLLCLLYQPSYFILWMFQVFHQKIGVSCFKAIQFFRFVDLICNFLCDHSVSGLVASLIWGHNLTYKLKQQFSSQCQVVWLVIQDFLGFSMKGYERLSLNLDKEKKQ